MPMDPQLAALYGTNQDEGDVEKLAAAKLAGELAEGDEVDEAELSDEQAEALAQKLLAAEQGEDDAEEDEDGEEEVDDEAKEKLSEADYLGRVMAHAYTQELRKIASEEQEKTAGPKMDAFKAKAKGVGGKVMTHLKAHKKKYIGGAAGAAAVGGGALAYKKMKGKKKQSAAEPSALDILAERRALEILKENGIDPTQEAEQETEKTSASEPEMVALQNAVEQRAVALLQANGYIEADEKDETEKE